VARERAGHLKMAATKHRMTSKDEWQHRLQRQTGHQWRTRSGSQRTAGPEVGTHHQGSWIDAAVASRARSHEESRTTSTSAIPRVEHLPQGPATAVGLRTWRSVSSSRIRRQAVITHRRCRYAKLASVAASRHHSAWLALGQ
jgi:hypothetical protein